LRLGDSSHDDRGGLLLSRNTHFFAQTLRIFHVFSGPFYAFLKHRFLLLQGLLFFSLRLVFAQLHLNFLIRLLALISQQRRVHTGVLCFKHDVFVEVVFEGRLTA